MAIHALASPVAEVANRAEWMLVKAGPAVLPPLWRALPTSTAQVRTRLVHVLAWQGDASSLPALQRLQAGSPEESQLIAWAIQNIELLRFPNESTPRAD